MFGGAFGLANTHTHTHTYDHQINGGEYPNIHRKVANNISEKRLRQNKV